MAFFTGIIVGLATISLASSFSGPVAGQFEILGRLRLLPGRLI